MRNEDTIAEVQGTFSILDYEIARMVRAGCPTRKSAPSCTSARPAPRSTATRPPTAPPTTDPAAGYVPFERVGVGAHDDACAVGRCRGPDVPDGEQEPQQRKWRASPTAWSVHCGCCRLRPRHHGHRLCGDRRRPIRRGHLPGGTKGGVRERGPRRWPGGGTERSVADLRCRPRRRPHRDQLASRSLAAVPVLRRGAGRGRVAATTSTRLVVAQLLWCPRQER